jgi:nitrate reductase alpha subunit
VRDPVAAFAEVAAEGAYRRERGRGGFVRCAWDEATELIAAATVHAIREHGPDRVGGFTPIPAMWPVSFVAGTRFALMALVAVACLVVLGALRVPRPAARAPGAISTTGR